MVEILFLLLIWALSDKHRASFPLIFLLEVGMLSRRGPRLGPSFSCPFWGQPNMAVERHRWKTQINKQISSKNSLLPQRVFLEV